MSSSSLTTYSTNLAISHFNHDGAYDGAALGVPTNVKQRIQSMTVNGEMRSYGDCIWRWYNVVAYPGGNICDAPASYAGGANGGASNTIRYNIATDKLQEYWWDGLYDSLDENEINVTVTFTYWIG